MVLSERIRVRNSPRRSTRNFLTGRPDHPLDIKNIVYRNVYTQNSNQMMMIKSNGGSGTLQNAQFLNFMGHSNAYTLDLNAFWSNEKTASGSGVQYKNLTFAHWKGTCSNGRQRAPIQVLCPPEVPCYDVTIDDVNIWTESGSSELYRCQSAFGQGGCLKDSDGSSALGTYTSTMTVTTMATRYVFLSYSRD